MNYLRERCVDFIIWLAKRTPYSEIHHDGDLYMERYWLVKPRSIFGFELPSARVHRIVRSDKDRCLHDHPWPFVTWIMRGGYFEELPFSQKQHPALDRIENWQHWREAGEVIRHAAADRHRLHIPLGGEAWTLFIMGPKRQSWGFYTPDRGKVYWREYLNDWTTVTASD